MDHKALNKFGKKLHFPVDAFQDSVPHFLDSKLFQDDLKDLQQKDKYIAVLTL